MALEIDSSSFNEVNLSLRSPYCARSTIGVIAKNGRKAFRFRPQNHFAVDGVDSGGHSSEYIHLRFVLQHQHIVERYHLPKELYHQMSHTDNRKPSPLTSELKQYRGQNKVLGLICVPSYLTPSQRLSGTYQLEYKLSFACSLVRISERHRAFGSEECTRQPYPSTRTEPKASAFRLTNSLCRSTV